MKHLALILALLTPQMAAARIGESVEACDERYGKPRINGNYRFYQKQKIDIRARIWKGVAHEMIYILTKAGLGKDARPVMHQLLQKNAVGEWRVSEEHSREEKGHSFRVLNSECGKYVAMMDIQEGHGKTEVALSIMSYELLNHEEAGNKEEEEGLIQGF